MASSYISNSYNKLILHKFCITVNHGKYKTLLEKTTQEGIVYFSVILSERLLYSTIH